ncbi:hypothetical protein V6N11_073815 [Hibiscus sabdariffa]|uniref:Uncharacterized protein n=1 Tax=Hibiscus sabdariffa TaxID=183260 RepID=A0ABR2P4P7_9ROSI
MIDTCEAGLTHRLKWVPKGFVGKAVVKGENASVAEVGEPSAAGKCVVGEGSTGHNVVLVVEQLDLGGLALTDAEFPCDQVVQGVREMSVDPGGLASADVQGASVVLAIDGSDVIQNDTSVHSVDDLNSVHFPTLQDSAGKKGKGRGKGEKNKRFAGSSNKFETLVKDIGEAGGRPPQAAAAVVAKKKDHVLKAKSVSEGSGVVVVGVLNSST